MSVTSIFISNLPWGITPAELGEQLTELHPNIFKPLQEGCSIMDIHVFTSHKNVMSAVVRGLDVNFERMMLDIRGLKICHLGKNPKLVSIKPDAGDPRRKDGTFLQMKASVAKREFIDRVGLTHRRIIEIFDPNFWKSVNTNPITISFDDGHDSGGTKQECRMLFINSIEVDKTVLSTSGGLSYFKSSGRDSRQSCVMFHSSLEGIQAIAKFNLNPAILMDKIPRLSTPKFTSDNGNIEATIRSQIGLGTGGRIIDIEYFSKNYGYVPFAEFGPGILNKNFLNTVSSHCWRCKQSFNLIGVNLHLSSIAARCKCIYDKEGKYSGYHWPNETFTRLMAARRVNGNRTELIINHYPIKQVYHSVAEYREIIAPLLEEEWYSVSSGFGNENKTNATVRQSWTIETTKNDGGRMISLYAAKLEVVPQKAWVQENPKCITECTIYWQKQDAKAKICSMELNEEGTFLIITIRIKIRQQCTPLPINGVVELVPKPNRNEYMSLRKNLNYLVDNPTSVSYLNQLLLDSGKCPTQGGWKSNDQKEIPVYCSIFIGLSALRMCLNHEQRLAMDTAEDFAVSIVQGPPGTGKTFTVAAISLTLSLKEKGGVLICAPSNFAADGVAIKLNQIMNSSRIYNPVLRIFSKTRVKNLLKSGKASKDEMTFLSLHEEVRKSPKWLNDPSIKEMNIIKEHLNNGNEHLLTENQAKDLEQHEIEIQDEVVQNFKILVCTVGCLAEDRVITLVKLLDITTVILDEAGQLSQPTIMNVFNVHPSRIVLAGDQMQLSATVKSFAASSAGLHLSLLDLIPFSDRTTNFHQTQTLCPPPWTTLLMQHRMHPHIRKLVSHLTYDGKLVDSNSVLQRSVDPIYASLELDLGNKRICVLDHCWLEKEAEEDHGFINPGEADVVVKFVKVLTAKGIPLSDITIVTFYEQQRRIILSALKNEVEVKNVDAFQGRENRIIVISFVRGNNSKKTNMGFLNSINRINVALSRAQEFLFLACNFRFYRSSRMQHINKLCNLLQENAHVIDAQT